MSQNILLVLGSLVSKIIVAFFVCIGAAACADHLRANYTVEYQILYGGTILIWLILGAIFEYNKIKKKGVN